jgi:hypothetical protein
LSEWLEWGRPDVSETIIWPEIAGAVTIITLKINKIESSPIGELSI